MNNKSAAAAAAGGPSQGVVLRLLRDKGPTSRAELARLSGLSTTSLTRVVARLLELGWVSEGEVSGSARVGRPATDIALVDDAFVVCGVQVGVGQVRIGIADLRARITHRGGFDFDVGDSPQQVLANIATRIRRMLGRVGRDHELLAVGVAIPSTVDAEQRRPVMSLNLGWADVDVAGQLEAALAVPVIIDHNVRSMALAEARYGAGRGRRHLAYVYLSTGIGAGLVMHGEPFRGGVHGGSELGHLQVVEKGRRCVCGARGCLETVLSEARLTERVELAASLDPDGALAAARVRTSNPLVALETAAADGDRRASGILGELVGYLGPALASLVNLLNPELILLGGLFADIPERTLDRIRSALWSSAFPVLRDAVLVERSTFGLDAGVAGGAAIALDRFFYQPPVGQ